MILRLVLDGKVVRKKPYHSSLREARGQLIIINRNKINHLNAGDTREHLEFPAGGPVFSNNMCETVVCARGRVDIQSACVACACAACACATACQRLVACLL